MNGASGLRQLAPQAILLALPVAAAAQPLAGGRAVIGLSCERDSWTLFRLSRAGQEVYNFGADPAWSYLPAGSIAGTRFCTEPVRIAE
ncbi:MULTISPECIES: hypothetical protein [Aphanothece]